jgi:hypothetical protein
MSKQTRKVEEAWATFKPELTEADLIECLKEIGMTQAEAECHAAKCCTADTRPNPHYQEEQS